jgi:hypothetical protein
VTKIKKGRSKKIRHEDIKRFLPLSGRGQKTATVIPVIEKIVATEY